MKLNLQQALEVIANGGIIAYPTETTFGLGCDAFNKDALKRLMKIKQRSEKKGFIVLINNFNQLEKLTAPIAKSDLQLAYDKWPGPYTFVFPSLKTLPKLLTGSHNSIAIRMSSHQMANQLCQNSPITSTSANISGQVVAKAPYEIEKIFGDLIDGIIAADPGDLAPSKIINILTKQQYR